MPTPPIQELSSSSKAGQPILEIRGLRKSFGAHDVLTGVDLSVRAGTVTTVIGKSGCGKSVMLKTVAGLLERDGGEVVWPGADSGRQRTRSSFMFQGNALFDSLTAFENVALPLREATEQSREEIEKRVRAILARMGLEDAAERAPGKLSGGMQKRVAFARALVTEPEIVFFDEPTTGLDPERKYGIFEMIEEYRRDFGFTALLVSHDIPEVFDISDRVAWLDGGRIRFEGPPDAITGEVETALEGFLRKGKTKQARKSNHE